MEILLLPFTTLKKRYWAGMDSVCSVYYWYYKYINAKKNFITLCFVLSTFKYKGSLLCFTFINTYLFLKSIGIIIVCNTFVCTIITNKLYTYIEWTFFKCFILLNDKYLFTGKLSKLTLLIKNKKIKFYYFIWAMISLL